MSVQGRKRRSEFCRRLEVWVEAITHNSVDEVSREFVLDTQFQGILSIDNQSIKNKLWAQN